MTVLRIHVVCMTDDTSANNTQLCGGPSRSNNNSKQPTKYAMKGTFQFVIPWGWAYFSLVENATLHVRHTRYHCSAPFARCQLNDAVRSVPEHPSFRTHPSQNIRACSPRAVLRLPLRLRAQLSHGVGRQQLPNILLGRLHEAFGLGRAALRSSTSRLKEKAASKEK